VGRMAGLSERERDEFDIHAAAAAAADGWSEKDGVALLLLLYSFEIWNKQGNKLV
jgi:hypothetical protein